MEVFVIDNHSDDESVQWIRNTVRNEPRVRVIETKDNLGFGGGYEAGIRFAAGKYLLICNPEKLLPEDGLVKMIEKMERETDIGILTPKLVHTDGTVRESPRSFPRPLDVVAKRTFLSRIIPLTRYLQLNEDPDKERDTDWVAGGCLMIRRDLFEELGGFDPQFFLFFEDIDLCRRCWEAGKRVVYFPSVVASDRKRRLSEGGLKRLLFTKIGRIHIVSMLRYFRKWKLAPLPEMRR